MYSSCSHILFCDLRAVVLFRHPDKNKDPKAEDMFIVISKSYEVGMYHI